MSNVQSTCMFEFSPIFFFGMQIMSLIYTKCSPLHPCTSCIKKAGDLVLAPSICTRQSLVEARGIMEFRYGISIYDPFDFIDMQKRISGRQRHGPVRPILLTSPISIDSARPDTIFKVEVRDFLHNGGDEPDRRKRSYRYEDGHYNAVAISCGNYAIVGELPKPEDLHSWGYAILQTWCAKNPTDIDAFLILFSRRKLGTKLTVCGPS